MSTEHLLVAPHSNEAEQAVLGGLMLHPASFSKVADWLVEDDFYRRDHRVIFRAFSELAGKSEASDAVTMCEWMKEQGMDEFVSGAYVLELAGNTPSAANITAWAEIVVEKSRLRVLCDIGTGLAGAALKPGKSSGDLVAVATQKLSSMVATRSRAGLHGVKPGIKRLFAEMNRRYESGERLLGLATPWEGLNTFTKGLRDGLLYVVGARPSMGKSVFGGQLVTATALDGKRAALFAIEGSEEEFLARSCAAFGNIPFDWVEQPDKDNPDDNEYWGRMTTITSDLLKAPLLVDDTPYLKIEQLMARARREHQHSPIRLIVIDHLHDMDFGSGDPQRARMEIGRAAGGAKTLAKELGCPVVLLAQLNRNLGQRSDKRPIMLDLRESGDIEQKADVILFLHREDYYDTIDRKTHLKGVIELIPAKGRNLRLGETIHLANRFDRMRMVDWDGPLPHPPAEPETPPKPRSSWKPR